jgi:hypothetical protein
MPTLAEILASKHTRAAFEGLSQGRDPKQLAAEVLSRLAQEKVGEVVAAAIGGQPVQRAQEAEVRFQRAKPVEPFIDVEFTRVK